MQQISNPTPTMSSREIAELVESRHDSVKRTIERLIDRGTISEPPLVDGPKSANGVTTQEYLLGKRDSYVVVAQLSPEFTARLVDRWQELESAAVSLVPALPDFTSPALAARAWAEQYEARAGAEARVAELAPKAEFVDRFVEAGGRYGLQNAGRALGCRPNKFIDWLKAEGFIFYADGSLVPRQQYLQAKLFEVKNTVGGDDKVHTQSFVTPKGVSYFAARIPDSIRSIQPTTALAAAATAH